MTFLQDDDHVVFLDKTEDNPLRVNGRPAWAASFNYKTKHLTPFDIVTNTFCAGGAPAGNGRMVITGGNIAVGPGGKSSAQGVNPYYAVDGGFALNIYDAQTNSFTSRKRGIQRERWYPSMEPMADGSVSIVSGAVSMQSQDAAGTETEAYQVAFMYHLPRVAEAMSRPRLSLSPRSNFIPRKASL